MLVARVIEHQFRDHPQPAPMRLVEEFLEVFQRAVARVDRHVVRDVVAVVAQRRGIKRQQPERGHAELLQVVELLDDTPEVADAIAIAIVEGADVELVDDGVFEPERIGWGLLHGFTGGVMAFGSAHRGLSMSVCVCVLPVIA